MDYRNLARVHLRAAADELKAQSDQRLIYAALELRMAMEALTYDRALAYKDEFPPDEYQTWQPRKVMLVLLDIDPTADKDSSLAVGVEEEYGHPAPNMNFLGTEKILSMSTLRKHYDALGSFLHVQSMKDFRSGMRLDFSRIRIRCDEIYAYVSQVLSSPIFNVTLGSFAQLTCSDCGNNIRKRIRSGEREVIAECHHCKASYTITDEGNRQVKWTPCRLEIECANKDCRHKAVVWRRDLEVGKYWKCDKCQGENSLTLAVSYQVPTG